MSLQQAVTLAPPVIGAKPIEAITVSAFAHSMSANGEAWFWAFGVDRAPLTAAIATVTTHDASGHAHLFPKIGAFGWSTFQSKKS